MKAVAADSGAAILNDRFEPKLIVATVAGLVEPPYRHTNPCLAEPIFANVEDGHLLITHELKMCQKLLKEVKADVVHLDMSLGGLSLEELSVVGLSKMRVSRRARQHILKILPKLRKTASDIKRVYGIEVLAMGKESVPVRIAELSCGAYGVLYAAEKAVKEKANVRLGLPVKCSVNVSEGGVSLKSLIAGEHDLISFVRDFKKILNRVSVSEMLNPCARGFRALEINPRV
ncbi:MAG: DUF4152 family protein [Candidatus Bathyarchaeota archaeon]|nr:DUF4152 family protein [Candidatus Bathyarchaeota archaeon]MDH5732315.1 DUF4152 family protein [Candidatus Bathyarchaeota archaeon]